MAEDELPPEFDLDSPMFDAQSYVSHILATKSMDELLQLDNDLRKELSALDMKHLDANLKTLVQNNFYKFVLASDTLQSVTKSIGEMEGKLAVLDESMGHIETLNESVSGHLHEKRSQIEQLSGVYSFMEQLEFLIDLPKKLDAALALAVPSNKPATLRENLATFDEWHEAIAFYNQTKDVLATYGDVATFDALRSQCRTRIEALHTRIAGLFEQPSTPAETLVALGTLLRALGETAGELCAKLLAVRCEALEAVISKWRTFPINPATPDEPKQQTYTRFVSGLHRDFLPPFFGLIQLNFLFTDGKDAPGYDESDEEHKQQSRLSSKLKAVFDAYIDCLGEQLLKSESPSAMFACIQLIDHEFREACAHPIRLNLPARPSPSVLDFARAAATRLIDRVSYRLVSHYFEDFTAHWKSIVSKISEQINGAEGVAESVEAAVNEQLKTLLQALTPFLSSGRSLSFLKTVSGEFGTLFKTMADQTGCYVSLAPSELPGMAADGDGEPVRESVEDVGRTFMLVLAKALLYMAVGSVDLVSRQMASYKAPFTKGDEAGDIKIPWSEDEVREVVVGTARDLLRRYCELQVSLVKRLLGKAFEDDLWKERTAPQSVDVTFRLIADEMGGAVQHAERILGKLRADVSRLKQLSSPADEAPLSSSRLAIGPSLRLESALSGSEEITLSFKIAEFKLAFVKSCIRELAAHVQRTQFSTHGYQLDVYHLQRRLSVDGGTLLKGVSKVDAAPCLRMLDEVLELAFEHTSDPLPLTHTELVALHTTD